jgi:hypothetical protein
MPSIARTAAAAEVEAAATEAARAAAAVAAVVVADTAAAVVVPAAAEAAVAGAEREAHTPSTATIQGFAEHLIQENKHGARTHAFDHQT